MKNAVQSLLLNLPLYIFIFYVYLEISTDSLLFGDLNSKSGNNHFIKKVAELTETFTPNEKELLLKTIEIINEYRNSAE